jgi:lipoprotein-releasing system permease protein
VQPTRELFVSYFHRLIALRHVQSTRGTLLAAPTWLAIASVAVGLAAFVTLLSVGGGFIEAFRSSVLGVNPHVVVTKYGMLFPEYRQVEEALLKVEGVESAAPFVLHEMLVTRVGSRARPGGLIKGVDVDTIARTPQLAAIFRTGAAKDLLHATAGAIDPATGMVTASGSGEIPLAIGYVMAERLKVVVGDAVTLVSPLRGVAAMGMEEAAAIPASVRGRIVGILDTGFYDYDNRLVLADYRAIQPLFGRGDVVTGVDIRLQDPELAAALVPAIEAVLPTGRFRATDWRMLNKNLFQSLNQQRLWLSLVMGIVLLVAASVILVVLVMIVLRKRTQIGILRSMGASRRDILTIFLLEGALIGAIGIGIGLLLGLLACAIVARIDFGLEYEVYRIKTLPIAAHPIEFGIAALVAMVLTLLATLPAAWRASTVRPVDALRGAE